MEKNNANLKIGQLAWKEDKQKPGKWDKLKRGAVEWGKYTLMNEWQGQDFLVDNRRC